MTAKAQNAALPGQQEVLTDLRPQDLHGHPLSLRPALQLSAKTAGSAATSTPQTPRKARHARASLPCKACNGMDLTRPNQVALVRCRDNRGGPQSWYFAMGGHLSGASPRDILRVRTRAMAMAMPMGIARQHKTWQTARAITCPGRHKGQTLD